jgi:hypothetical protein
MADFSEQFILQTDASGVALGAILSQVRDGVKTAHCACLQTSECPGAHGFVYIRIGMFGGAFCDSEVPEIHRARRVYPGD